MSLRSTSLKVKPANLFAPPTRQELAVRRQERSENIIRGSLQPGETCKHFGIRIYYYKYPKLSFAFGGAEIMALRHKIKELEQLNFIEYRACFCGFIEQVPIRNWWEWIQSKTSLVLRRLRNWQ